MIDYCSDSMHELAGKSGIPLPEIEKPEVPDFDLPDVSGEGAKASAPRIHIGGDTCVSCEG